MKQACFTYHLLGTPTQTHTKPCNTSHLFLSREPCSFFLGFNFLTGVLLFSGCFLFFRSFCDKTHWIRFKFFLTAQFSVHGSRCTFFSILYQRSTMTCNISDIHQIFQRDSFNITIGKGISHSSTHLSSTVIRKRAVSKFLNTSCFTALKCYRMKLYFFSVRDYKK